MLKARNFAIGKSHLTSLQIKDIEDKKNTMGEEWRNRNIKIGETLCGVPVYNHTTYSQFKGVTDTQSGEICKECLSAKDKRK